MQFQLTERDVDLLIDALTRAAARYESCARFRPAARNVHTHEATAKDMRRLRKRLENEEQLP